MDVMIHLDSHLITMTTEIGVVPMTTATVVGLVTEGEIAALYVM